MKGTSLPGDCPLGQLSTPPSTCSLEHVFTNASSQCEEDTISDSHDSKGKTMETNVFSIETSTKTADHFILLIVFKKLITYLLNARGVMLANAL